jgi:uncharacterized membrane protein
MSMYTSVHACTLLFMYLLYIWKRYVSVIGVSQSVIGVIQYSVVVVVVVEKVRGKKIKF